MNLRAILLPLAGLSAIPAMPVSPALAIDYREEIRPILSDKCFKCHSGPRAKGKLRMEGDDFFAERIGGDDPVIIPGKPEESLLAIKAGLPPTDGEAMPPPPARSRGAEPMTSKELGLVKQWISAGASFEKGEVSEAPAAEPAMKTTEMLTWTNTDGNSLEAAYVSAQDGMVTLRREDGSTFDYPYDKLAPASQEQARKLHAENQ